MAITSLQSDRSARIAKAFNEFNINTMSLLDGFYDKDIVFVDPVHKVEGLAQIKKYYASLYKNVVQINFDFKSETIQDDTHALTWTMNLKARGLNGGNPVAVEGVTILKFNPASDKVIFHRDYFDMGEFIYERIPVLNSVIRFIKNKLGSME